MEEEKLIEGTITAFIPMPEPRNNLLKDKLSQMMVGDCLIWNAKKSNGVYTIAKNQGKRVAVKKTENGLIKIWRIA